MQRPVTKTAVGGWAEAGVTGRSSLDSWRRGRGINTLTLLFLHALIPLPLTNPSENLGTWETRTHTPATVIQGRGGQGVGMWTKMSRMNKEH